MTCVDDHEWTIAFPDVSGEDGPLELRPYEMTFKQERRAFDYCRAKFPATVGEMLKPHTRQDDGLLRDRRAANVKLDGDPVQTLMFSPDGIRYGDRYTHLRLFDLQRLLESGTVDKKWDKVTLVDAYEYVFNQREDRGILQDIEFTMPDRLKTPDGNPLTLVSEMEAGAEKGLISGLISGAQVAGDDTKRMVEGQYVIEFDSISPLKALWKLNEDYQLQTWVDRDSVLWVGIPEATANRHIAAPDDERVWRYTNVNVAHPREPVKRVIVRGAWQDQPGFNIENELSEWFNPLGGGEDGNVFGSGDVNATGIAERTDIDYGLTYEKKVDAKKDAVEDVAHQAFLEEVRQQNSGQIHIDPTKSGDFTPIKELGLGDFLQIVPDDEAFDHRDNITASTGQITDEPEDRPTEWCGQSIQNEAYTVTGIQHKVDGSGRWTVIADVALWPHDIADRVGTKFMYYDPEGDEYLTEDEASSFLIEDI